MFYLESGQFSNSYRQDRRLFRLWQQRWALAGLIVAAYTVVPWLGNDYWFSAILIPFLVLSLAGVGQNVLTGYAGQLSLGSAAFMAVGAFAAYNLQLRVSGMPLLLGFFLAGLCAVPVGVIFGLPSLRIKGFYLLVSTLAAQFLIEWIFTQFSWFSNDSTSGVISAPPLVVLGHNFSTPLGRYLLTLSVVLPLVWLATNLVHSQWGRNWMAVRDMDTAAAVIGIPLGRTKLLAFAISSFLLGVAGALWAFTYLGTVEPHGFDLNRSFQILFIIIIGGMGSILGNFLGAAFIVLLPILLSIAASAYLGDFIQSGQLDNLQKMKEPEGLAKLWQSLRAKAHGWPLRYWT